MKAELMSKESRTCKKCGQVLPPEYEGDRCSDCAVKRKRKIIGGIAIGAVTAGITAGCVYLKLNPDTAEKLIAALKNALPNRGAKDVKAAKVSKAVGTAKSATAQIGQQVADGQLFSTERFFITSVDDAKIDAALNEGRISLRVFEDHGYELENGLMTLDELLRRCNADDIINRFTCWRDCVGEISQEQLERIAQEAAAVNDQVKSVEVIGNTINVMFKSNSGKSCWQAIYDFGNAEGGLSPEFVCRAAFPKAKVLDAFGRDVLNFMKCEVEGRMQM